MAANHRISGLLLFLAAAQFTIGLMVAAALTPGYSIADDTISALGAREGALAFNASVIILGLLVIGAALFWRRGGGGLLLTVLLLVTGVGAVGVGVFPTGTGILHGVFSLLAFLFGGLSAILSTREVRPPLQYLAAILGVIGLLSLALFLTGNYLGLGIGGMERMIVLPVLAWAMGFGGYLMTPDSGGKP